MDRIIDSLRDGKLKELLIESPMPEDISHVSKDIMWVLLIAHEMKGAKAAVETCITELLGDEGTYMKGLAVLHTQLYLEEWDSSTFLCNRKKLSEAAQAAARDEPEADRYREILDTKFGVRI